MNMLSLSQCPIYSNVCIRLRDKDTGHIITERNIKNRVTKHGLNGLSNLITGYFTSNRISHDIIDSYVPKYLALGYNTIPVDSDNYILNPRTSTIVDIGDTSLFSELSDSSKARIRLEPSSLTSESNSLLSSIKITFSYYADSPIYLNRPIREAGLFCSRDTNTCWARTTFNEIKATENTVIETIWVVNIISVGKEVYPTDLELHLDGSVIEDDIFFMSINESKIIVPVISPSDGSVTDRNLVWESSNDDAFTVNSNGVVTCLAEGSESVITCSASGGIKKSVNVSS